MGVAWHADFMGVTVLPLLSERYFHASRDPLKARNGRGGGSMAGQECSP